MMEAGFFGRLLTDFYYKAGSKIAVHVERHDLLRKILLNTVMKPLIWAFRRIGF